MMGDLRTTSQGIREQMLYVTIQPWLIRKREFGQRAGSKELRSCECISANKKDHGRWLFRREAVDRSTRPMMTTKMAASHKGDAWIYEVFPMQTNGNAGREGACEAGTRSLFRRSGLTVKCQTAETRRGTASFVQGCSATTLRNDEENACLAGDVFPKFSSLGAGSCEPFEAVAGWAAG